MFESQVALLHQTGSRFPEIVPEDGAIRPAERQLVGGAAQVIIHDVRVGRVDNRSLRRPAEELVRIVDEVLVQGVLAGHQDHQRHILRPAGPPGLLPERGNRAREGAQQGRIQPPDVHPQFEGVGCGDADQLSREEPGLDVPPVPRRVTGSIRRYPVAVSAETAGGADVDQLGGTPAPPEGDGMNPAAYQVHVKIRRLSDGRPAAARILLRERRVPYRHHPFAGGRVVAVHQRHVHSAQALGQVHRVADGRGSQHECRIGAVVGREPAQAPDDVGAMATEHPSQVVHLVDHHMAQAGQEPAPQAVIGEDPVVQHVRVGQDDIGAPPDPGALFSGKVAVVGGYHHLREAQGLDGRELVLGQCLGRKDE